MSLEYIRTREEWLGHIRRLKDVGFKSYELLACGYDVDSIWEVYVNG
jgi:hypothetical protein